MSAEVAWWEAPASAPTPPPNARASTAEPEIDWLGTSAPAAPQKAPGGPVKRDVLAEWLGEEVPDPGAAARREERETRRLSNIAAGPKPTGRLVAGQTWMLGDWLRDPQGGSYLGNVRFVHHKQAQGMVADFKRDFMADFETPGAAWRFISMAFGPWADPEAVYRAVSEIQELEWVWTQYERSKR